MAVIYENVLLGSGGGADLTVSVSPLHSPSVGQKPAGSLTQHGCTYGGRVFFPRMVVLSLDTGLFACLLFFVGKIPEVLARGVVDSLTKLVLVNAIYFKGKWHEEFRKESTTDAPFRLNKVRGWN